LPSIPIAIYPTAINPSPVMNIAITSPSIKAQYLIDLWNETTFWRTKFPVANTINIIDEYLLPLLDEVEAAEPDSKTEALKVLEAKKLIYESLWEHFGVQVYFEDEERMWIDVKSDYIANYIESDAWDARYMATLEQKFGSQYINRWIKIEIQYPCYDIVEDKNLLTDLLHDAITSARNTSATTIQRSFKEFQEKRRNKAATTIQKIYRGWKTRKDVTWNIHHPYGKYLMHRKIAEWSLEEIC
jgi:hypothetical protein